MGADRHEEDTVEVPRAGPLSLVANFASRRGTPHSSEQAPFAHSAPSESHSTYLLAHAAAKSGVEAGTSGQREFDIGRPSCLVNDRD